MYPWRSDAARSSSALSLVEGKSIGAIRPVHRRHIFATGPLGVKEGLPRKSAPELQPRVLRLRVSDQRLAHNAQALKRQLQQFHGRGHSDQDDYGGE